MEQSEIKSRVKALKRIRDQPGMSGQKIATALGCSTAHLQNNFFARLKYGIAFPVPGPNLLEKMDQFIEENA